MDAVSNVFKQQKGGELRLLTEGERFRIYQLNEPIAKRKFILEMNTLVMKAVVERDDLTDAVRTLETLIQYEPDSSVMPVVTEIICSICKLVHQKINMLLMARPRYQEEVRGLVYLCLILLRVDTSITYIFHFKSVGDDDF